ncbi:glycosyltransferase family 2 protein [Acidocella sp.]|uniref:glycosyltransferase family 2 protein n=1 Tax=Acidocella sp. TaxID=50710 RepID=UPI00260ACD37|nr:glycosyltransferase family 2 protein [Acidocella sp.]
MRVGCVVMQRNEVNALEPWLLYHAHLFGLENLCVIDHGSADSRVVNTLDWYEGEGLSVLRLPAGADYTRKGEFVTERLREMERRGGYDFLLPLDCDEFLALRRAAGDYTCRREEILAALAIFQGRPEILEVKENLLNILGLPGRFLPLPYQKVFFTAGHLGAVDHGSHTDISGRGAASLATPFVYMHFHHKPWAEQIKASQEKLRPFVDITDARALAAFRGPGWHLLLHINEGEAAYHAVMTEAAKYQVGVDGLMECFAALGIDPLFFEKPAGCPASSP